MVKNETIYYKEPVFRPPSEANSLLITATEGCTFRCSFCYPYLKKKFVIRRLEDIKKDLDIARKIYGTRVEKLFLLDGNAFVMKSLTIVKICEYAHSIFPNLKQITAYSHAKDIIRKSPEELKKIAESGFTMVYVGIETGDDDLLQKIHKDTTSDEIRQAAFKCYESGIIFSGTVILGLAGNNKEASKKHALETAKLINSLNPPKDWNISKWYIAALTLMIPPTTEIYNNKTKGNFQPSSNKEILIELRQIIENINENLHNCIFRSNHASNYVILKGILSQDKQKFLNQIDYGLNNPNSLKPEYYRGL